VPTRTSALLAFVGREAEWPAGMAMARHTGALEVHEVRQRRLGRSPTELGRGHQLQQGRWRVIDFGPENAPLHPNSVEGAVKFYWLIPPKRM
jgi:hypothetical protein